MGLTTNDSPEFKVFPNPTQNEITIQGLSGEEQLSLLDMNGRKLRTYQVAGNQFSITLEDFSEGVYFIVINCSKNASVHKKHNQNLILLLASNLIGY